MVIAMILTKPMQLARGLSFRAATGRKCLSRAGIKFRRAQLWRESLRRVVEEVLDEIALFLDWDIAIALDFAVAFGRVRFSRGRYLQAKSSMFSQSSVP
jgi:hypothetical protein